MIRVSQANHSEDETKELPLTEKQDAPCEVGAKDLNIENNASTPYALKWKIEFKGSSNPSQGILGTCPNSNKTERQNIQRSKGVKSDHSREEKWEVVEWGEWVVTT